MLSFWNSFEVVDTLRLIAQWTAGVCTILLIVFSMRANTLKKRSDAEREKNHSAEIERLNTKADSATAQIHGAKEDARIAKEEIGKAKIEVQNAKEKISPRNLTKKQIQIIGDEFKKIYVPAVESNTLFFVSTKALDIESKDYGKQIFEAITSNKEFIPATRLGLQLNDFHGISIFINDDDKGSEVLKMVQSAFTKAGIRFINKSFDKDTFSPKDGKIKAVFIVVGNK